jgi:hypothetical protein
MEEVPPAAMPQPAPPVAQPKLGDHVARMGAELLGRVGEAQRIAIERNQVISAVSQLVTDTIANAGANVWRMLRGAD